MSTKMSHKETARTSHVSVMVTPAEYARLRNDFDSTTFRFFSQYVRALLLKKPATFRHRNASLDDFLPVALQIKNELEEIRRKFADSLKTLQAVPGYGDAAQAIQFLLTEAILLKHSIERIRSSLIDICEKCKE